MAGDSKRQSSYFEGLLDNMLEGCQVIDNDWRYLYVNDVVAQHGRKPKDELLGQRMMDVYRGIEKTPVFETLSRCMESRTSARLINEFEYEDGSKAWFELNVQPVPEGLLVMSLDITLHVEAKQRIERQIERLQTLRAIDLAILGTTDRKPMLDAILEKIRTSLDAEFCMIFLLNPTSLMLELTAISGKGKPKRNFMPIQVGDGITGRAALERETISAPDLSDAQLPAELRSLYDNEGFHSEYATPLIAKGQLLGTLTILSRTTFDASQNWLGFFETLAGQAAMALDSISTFDALQRSNIELKLAYDKTLEGWSRALDLRDKETEGHTQRVTAMTLKLARMAGMRDDELVHVRRGALLHDIGKMGIPDAILHKQEELTDEEWAAIRRHPDVAHDLLSPIAFLRPALDIPYCHHERWDGTGYPRGLKGEEIPLAARLFAVVDVWDALRSDRPYREAWSETKAIEHIKSNVGKHFCPQAVQLFLKLIDQEGTGSDL